MDNLLTTMKVNQAANKFKVCSCCVLDVSTTPQILFPTPLFCPCWTISCFVADTLLCLSILSAISFFFYIVQAPTAAKRFRAEVKAHGSRKSKEIKIFLHSSSRRTVLSFYCFFFDSSFFDSSFLILLFFQLRII